MLPDLEQGTVTAEENDKKVLVNIQPQGLLFLIGTIMYTYRQRRATRGQLVAIATPQKEF